MKKKDIVENDKTKIASVISELDQKKNEALQAAWKRVNKVHTHHDRSIDNISHNVKVDMSC